jgi:uncharacterized OB-fold protein
MTRVPFKEGLFEEGDGGPRLIGSRCRACGQVLFPAKPVCLNCNSADIETIHLGRDGSLYAYTTVYLPSEHFPPPYAVGWIELPEGMRVFSQVRGWQETPLKIGMPMRMSIETLWQDGDNEVTGYVFRPVDGSGGVGR